MVVASTRDKLATHAPFLLHPPLPLLLLLFSLVQSVKCKRDQSADASVGPSFPVSLFLIYPARMYFWSNLSTMASLCWQPKAADIRSRNPSLLLSLSLLLFFYWNYFIRSVDLEKEIRGSENVVISREKNSWEERILTDGAAIRTTHDAVLRLSLHFALELKRIFLPLLLDILLPSPRSTGNLILFLPLIIFVILRTIISSCNYTVKLCKGIYLSIFQRPS